MAKKGVYKITGNPTPKVGEKSFYAVEEWYPETAPSERNPANVTWELFVKGDNGFESTNIKKKGINHFTFGKNAYQFTYKVEGYLYKPEGNLPMSMIVQPQKNEEPAKQKEKDILGVSLTYEDGSEIKKPLSYRDRLKATAKCEGMEGEMVVFSLWEDDADKAGHNKNNQFITKSPPTEINKYGKAVWTFPLNSTFISLANKREDDRKQHEYYVTVEYNGKLDASGNVNVDNPDYKPPVSAPKAKPKSDTPKASTKPNSPNNQTDKKGNITSVKLADAKGKTFSQMPKFGETIQIIIEGKDLVGKKYNLRIWEHDLIGDNDLLYNQIHTFKADKQIIYTPLTKAMEQTGKLGNDTKNPDSGEYTGEWNDHQEIFAEVVFLSVSSKSSTIDVRIEEQPKPVDKKKSPAKVEKPKVSGTNTDCVCKKTDLVWGDKIGCNERKKVIEVAKNLGIDPNWLMTVIALETAETFSPSIDNGVGYVGLIQFGADAAKDVGTTQSALVKMSFINQMKYVEKHLDKKKSKFKTLADLYLAVLYPSASGHGSERDYVVLNGKAYQSNPLFFKEKGEWEWATKVNKRGKTIKYKKAVDPNGKTYVWEIAMVAQEVYTRGLGVKEKDFTCNKSALPKVVKTGNCLETWDSATNNRIAKLHPKIRCAVKNFINEVDTTMGIKLRIIQGFRTYAEQNTLYAQGRTTKGKKVTNAKGGQSNHNFGLAIDVAEIKNGNIDWNEQETVLPKIAPIGKKWGFEWGGDWKSLKDKPHFEMMFGKTLAELRTLYADNGKDHTKIPL